MNLSKTKKWFTESEDIPAEVSYSGWWNEVRDFDTQAYLRKIATPIFAIEGRDNFAYPYMEMANNYKKYANVTVNLFEEGDHWMLKWPFGEHIPPPSFVDGYLETYTTWIKNKCGAQVR